MISTTTSEKFERLRIRGVRLILGLVGWILASFVIGHATFALLPAVPPERAGDAGRLSAVIIAEVYALLIVALLVAMGGLAGTRERSASVAFAPAKSRCSGGFAIAFPRGRPSSTAITDVAIASLTTRSPRGREGRFVSLGGNGAL